MPSAIFVSQLHIMAKKLLKLDTTTMEADFFSEVSLVGIASGKPVYSFCNVLNQRLGLNFYREISRDIVVNNKSAEYKFPVYQHCVPLSEFRYTIYKLKVEDAMLISSLKNLDYIWMIQAMEPEAEASEFIARLRHIPEVQFATLLEPSKIKGKEYLIL